MPFNIASYALLLRLVAQATGYTADTFKIHLMDVHIYENHFDQVIEQLNRTPMEFPECAVGFKPNDMSPLTYLESYIQPDMIVFPGYQSHPAIKASMAV